MIVYIYDNGFCDPLNNTGTCRRFEDSKDIDAFIHFFIASMTARVIQLGRFRIFITDNNISFEEMDHYILMDDEYGVHVEARAIEEIDIPTMAKQVNEEFNKLIKAKDKAKRVAEKRIKDAREKSKN